VHFVAGGGQIDVGLVVLLEGGTVTVMAPAIGFDHDHLGGPKEIDKVPLDENVDRRRRQVRFPAERQEVDLTDGFRLQGFGIHFERDPPQPPNPFATTSAGDDPL
jgi:hypothetical protein